MRHLVLGGVRSGKSDFAERWIEALSSENDSAVVTYIATSQAWDEEMKARILAHQLKRSEKWSLIEEPLFLSQAIERVNNTNSYLIIECITLWLTNLLCLEDESKLKEEKNNFLSSLECFQGKLVIVSGEVGLGIMPINALARRFADELGSLNQVLAQQCQKVTLVSAGLPLTLKNESDDS